MNKLLSLPFFRYSVGIFIAIIAVTVLFPGFVQNIFATGGFLPHSFCYQQEPQVIWLHVISDVLIGLAYVCISLTLAYLVYRASENIPFHWVFLAFGTFIISCGFTHFMEVWTVWEPRYWLAGYVKVITAVASLVTAVALFPLVPKIFEMIESVKLSEERRLKLVRAHEELERSHRDLSVQKTELEQANQELEMFTYSVAHDLRAPLRSINGMLEVLETDHSSQFDAEGRRCAHAATDSARRMDRLVQDLLVYSKVSRERLDTHPIRLKEALNDALAAVEPERQARQARINLPETDVSVVGSVTLLAQVLVNLMANAIKYVPRDARPEVNVRVEENGSRVRVWIEDNGIGIAEQDQDKIFEMFNRLHSQKEYPGTGIGLTIVKRAMQRMGGTMGLESAPGHGSRFWFELARA